MVYVVRFANVVHFKCNAKIEGVRKKKTQQKKNKEQRGGNKQLINKSKKTTVQQKEKEKKEKQRGKTPIEMEMNAYFYKMESFLEQKKKRRGIEGDGWGGEKGVTGKTNQPQTGIKFSPITPTHTQFQTHAHNHRNFIFHHHFHWGKLRILPLRPRPLYSHLTLQLHATSPSRHKSMFY